MTAMRKFWTAVLLLPFMFLLVLLGSGMHYVLYERKQRAELAEQIKRYQIEFSPAQDRSATAAVEDDVVRDGDEEEEDPCEGLTLLRVDELRLLISEFYHVRPTDSEVAHIAWQCEPKHLPEGMEHLNSVLPPRPFRPSNFCCPHEQKFDWRETLRERTIAHGQRVELNLEGYNDLTALEMELDDNSTEEILDTGDELIEVRRAHIRGLTEMGRGLRAAAIDVRNQYDRNIVLDSRKFLYYWRRTWIIKGIVHC